jgi:hypothetical protein
MLSPIELRALETCPLTCEAFVVSPPAADRLIDEEHLTRPDPQSQGSDILGDLGSLVESWNWRLGPPR